MTLVKIWMRLAPRSLADLRSTGLIDRTPMLGPREVPPRTTGHGCLSIWGVGRR